jgi:UDP-glucose 4-epimerase
MPNLLKAVDDPEYVFSIFGNTYNTYDGTPVRDYIHVVDLADAHRCALENIDSLESNYETFNVGTGIGYSVMDVIKTMEAASCTNISRQMCEPRDGDVECVYADTTKIGMMFNWCANKTLVDMCQDSLR